jgi:hypothetical protein
MPKRSARDTSNKLRFGVTVPVMSEPTRSASAEAGCAPHTARVTASATCRLSRLWYVSTTRALFAFGLGAALRVVSVHDVRVGSVAARLGRTVVNAAAAAARNKARVAVAFAPHDAGACGPEVDAF